MAQVNGNSTMVHGDMESKHNDDGHMHPVAFDDDKDKRMDNQQLDLGLNDPQRWPKRTKIYASVVSCGFTFAL